ncbi:glycosyltransferase family 2 protein [Salegentibacter chungangensis]|uniref:Glycosyltransferase family 2 protein n=1 Tax=Salegentibacter chungangensis TaxID=1335724 RepID=A0ABW3NQG3_9FLAO
MSKQEELISIILPVFNGQEFLAQAIESCLNQTYKNLELIIVDDASEDKSLEISRAFAAKDNRLKIFSNKENLKLPGSLNSGHAWANGNFITWTSHDNVLKPDFLEKHFQNIVANKADISYSNYDMIFADGNIKREHHPGPPEYLLFGNQIGASFLYRKKVFEELSGYDENLFLVEDYDFWLRAGMNFKYSKIEYNLYSYRIQPESLTAKIYNEREWNREHDQALSKMFLNLKEKLAWESLSVEFLLKLFKNDKSALRLFLNNKAAITKDFKKYCGKELNYSELQNELYRQLRMVLKQHPEANTFLNVLRILRQERNILMHQKFNKKETIKLICKSLVN